ncbi:hypothetical protein [Nostoc sp. 106C]|nr:hypothetical protein [Nostoc sp. 106C]
MKSAECWLQDCPQAGDIAYDGFLGLSPVAFEERASPEGLATG